MTTAGDKKTALVVSVHLPILSGGQEVRLRSTPSAGGKLL